MAKKSITKTVEALKHDADKRKNIPTAEYQSVIQKEEEKLKTLKYPRNTDLDPQLVWRGKDEQDWSDLVVHAPPLYIQEKVQPKVLIDDLLKQTREQRDQEPGAQTDLFAEFNGMPAGVDKTEFYQHDQNWSNRMILGDSLQVMASLAEREGLRGKVQCIYFDPPYGIKFNSNFQWSTTSNKVTDGKADHITREPEQVKAFRDTWRDGIHSYLTYLRDRLTVARDLLTDSGSIFVQIGDENVHRVRALMEEVFGENNFIALICVKKTGGVGAKYLDTVFDYIVWFGKNAELTKYRGLIIKKVIGEGQGTGMRYDQVRFADLRERALTKQERGDQNVTQQLEGDGAQFFQLTSLNSESSSEATTVDFEFRGKSFYRTNWKTNRIGLQRLNRADRIRQGEATLRYRRQLEDFPGTHVANFWDDTGVAGKIYVVQTSTKVIERCILMATDPGDLVLDPTCGSGTTATVAEQWGRRWITIDTSRVALALARARIMGARYPYYLLADSPDGQRKEAEITHREPSSATTRNDIRYGFVYERVLHIMLESITNNAEIDVIWDKWQGVLEPLREKVNAALKKPWQEWEIPREADKAWPDSAKKPHADWWEARITRQKEIDASIAAKAEFEYLYDKPYENKKIVRVAGPFTVESLSPHRVLGVDENDELIDTVKDASPEYGAKQSFPQMILENLKTAGVQQAHKEDRITFTALTPWPGELVCAEGRFSSDQWPVVSDQKPATDHQPPATDHKSPTTEKRAAIFIGPEFGTVQRADLVAAAREAGDAGFDVLIACAFNYEAHTTEFRNLGRIPVLKARMNADLHMAEDLKNTGKGNLFVIFGEPDITVTNGQWLVTRNGRLLANYEHVKELSGLGSVEEINRAGRAGLSAVGKVSSRGAIRADEPNSTGSSVGRGEHRGGSRTGGDTGVSSVSGNRGRITGGGGDLPGSGGEVGPRHAGGDQRGSGSGRNRWSDAQRTQTLAALQSLSDTDFPLSLTTDHRAQVTVHGVDVFKPQTGEVISDGADGVACWFIDTDYNEESFFVRHAYFLGANDPYSALKTTLKAEVNAEAWATLNSDTSRPFERPKNGRIAVKVINHLGDEVMKVFKVS
jgi:adenine-specific DNA-methyltransferase